VDGDVNGDGLSNDRAFVFAASGDDDAPADMASLLSRLPGSARACLLRQTGRIAGRNTCTGPWLSSLDLQANLYPGGPRNQRVVVSVAAENVAAGLDYALHGRSGRHGWGQLASPDPLLLRVDGFDAAGRAFRYRVNPGFGRVPSRQWGTPFALRIQARIAVGADPATQALVAQAVAVHDQMEPAQVAAGLLRRWVNTPAAALAHDSGHGAALSPAQRAALLSAADSVSRGSRRLAAALGRVMSDLGSSGSDEVKAALAAQRDLQSAAQALLDWGWDVARATLGDAEWRRLPSGIRARPHASLPLASGGGVRLLPDL
jgi:hypothetical protein